MEYILPLGFPPTIGPIPIIKQGVGFALRIGQSVSETAEVSTFYSAPSGTGTVTFLDGVGAGAALVMTTQASDTTYENIRLNGEPFITSLTGNLAFYCKIKAADVSVAEWFVGLHDDDTADCIDVATHDGIGFHVDVAGASVDAMVGNGTNETETAILANSDLTDDTYFELAFICDRRDQVTFFANTGSGWVVETKISQYIPTSAQTLVVNVQSSSAAEVLTIQELAVGLLAGG